MTTRLAVFLCTAFCATAAAAERTQTPEQRCVVSAMFAEQAMLFHQYGQDMTMTLNTGTSDVLPEWRDLVIGAYDSPRYQTKRAQERAAAEYRDRIHVECLKALRGK